MKNQYPIKKSTKYMYLTDKEGKALSIGRSILEDAPGVVLLSVAFKGAGFNFSKKIARQVLDNRVDDFINAEIVERDNRNLPEVFQNIKEDLRSNFFDSEETLTETWFWTGYPNTIFAFVEVGEEKEFLKSVVTINSEKDVERLWEDITFMGNSYLPTWFTLSWLKEQFSSANYIENK